MRGHDCSTLQVRDLLLNGGHLAQNVLLLLIHNLNALRDVFAKLIRRPRHCLARTLCDLRDYLVGQIDRAFSKVRSLLLEYANLRIAFYQEVDGRQISEIGARTTKLQAKL